jgi:hypothetical protein
MSSMILPMVTPTPSDGAERAARQVDARQRLPATEEQHDDEAGHQHHARVLGEQEHGELDAGVLGDVAEHELGVTDGHVERRSGELGERGEEEDREAERLREHVPQADAGAEDVGGLLRLDDADERERAGLQRDRDGDEDQRQLVGDELCRGAHPADERELVGAGPAGHHDAEHADGRDGEDVEQPDLEVEGEHARTDREHGEGEQRRDEADPGGHGEHLAVRRPRDDVLLLDELDAVRDELQRAERSGLDGAAPGLQARHAPCARGSRRRAARRGTSR